MRFDVAVHFVSENNTYQAQVFVRRRVPNPGEIEGVTLTFATRHETAAAAIEEATTRAERINAQSEHFRALFDLVFKQVS
jgi:hypothetical protein